MFDSGSIKKALKKLPINIGVLSILILAGSITFLAISLSTFTLELALVRRDLPRALDRVDRQILYVQRMLVSVESSSQSFSMGLNKDISSGINKGISQGIVDLPLNTVANVGYKLSDTAASTTTHTYGFWQGFKEKLFFWQAKKSSTTEAKSKK
jgi:hypothetical protein